MPNRQSGIELSVADKIEPVNRYYRKISDIYRVFSAFWVLVLILYAVLVMMFFGEYVTYENIRYLARDLGAAFSSGGGDFSGIVYNGTETMKFAGFKNGLAAADRELFIYFDSSGIEVINESGKYSDPVIVPSEKYLLVYDLGGTSYSLYNQLTNVVKRTADQTIVSADVCDSGAYIMVTRSRETRYVVEVYNSALNHTMSIFKENYVLDCALSPKGDEIIICSAVPGDTDFNCEISVCKSGTEDVITKHYEHMMPLEVSAYDDGFAVLCDAGLYFFDYDGNESSHIPFDGMVLKYADMGEETIAAVGSINALGTENRVISVDISGKILLDTVIDKRVVGASASFAADENAVYLRTTDGVLGVKRNGEKTLFTTEKREVLDVIPVQSGAVICTKTGTVIFE